MGQEDLIKREIDQLGKVLRAILSKLLGLNDIDEVETGVEYAEDALKQNLNLDIDALLALPPAGIIETLVDDLKLSNASINILADIFLNLAHRFDELKQPEKAHALFQKTEQLFEYLILTAKNYSFEWYFKLGQIKNRLTIG